PPLEEQGPVAWEPATYVQDPISDCLLRNPDIVGEDLLWDIVELLCAPPSPFLDDLRRLGAATEEARDRRSDRLAPSLLPRPPSMLALLVVLRRPPPSLPAQPRTSVEPATLHEPETKGAEPDVLDLCPTAKRVEPGDARPAGRCDGLCWEYGQISD